MYCLHHSLATFFETKKKNIFETNATGNKDEIFENTTAGVVTAGSLSVSLESPCVMFLLFSLFSLFLLLWLMFFFSFFFYF